jgi:S-adenosyl methyltransferase
MWHQRRTGDEEEMRRILAESGLDISIPNAARIYDFLLGGKDNFAADREASRAAQQVYQGASAPVVPRSRQDIAGFFDGLTLVEPGVTDINHWPGKSPGPAAPLTLYGGLALKPDGHKAGGSASHSCQVMSRPR